MRLAKVKKIDPSIRLTCPERKTGMIAGEQVKCYGHYYLVGNKLTLDSGCEEPCAFKVRNSRNIEAALNTLKKLNG